MSAEQKLRVYWIPQAGMPGEPFIVEVGSVVDGVRVMEMLASYDAYQFDNHIKPDYANTGGLEMFEDGEWCSWIADDGEDNPREWLRQEVYRFVDFLKENHARIEQSTEQQATGALAQAPKGFT
jgi:hypothetical protein